MLFNITVNINLNSLGITVTTLLAVVRVYSFHWEDSEGERAELGYYYASIKLVINVQQGRDWFNDEYLAFNQCSYQLITRCSRRYQAVTEVPHMRQGQTDSSATPLFPLWRNVSRRGTLTLLLRPFSIVLRFLPRSLPYILAPFCSSPLHIEGFHGGHVGGLKQ